MPRQKSLLTFFRRDNSVQPKERETASAAASCSPGTQAVGSQQNAFQHESRFGAPLVPGTKRVQDDFPHGNQNKRQKLLEALGEDEGFKHGAWAEAQAKFEWMDGSKIRDGNGRRSRDPLFDNRTIRIPADALKKMSSSQRQYWETKSQYMDVVLFFKVGKFYELYEVDAEIGHKEFDWKMTVSGVGKCRQVGVPESGIEEAVQKLVTRGYKVGRMEQVETSEQAKARRGPSAVVERKLVQVMTPSTLIEGCIKPDAIHLLALKEECTGSTTVYGFAFADAAAGRSYLGSFSDNETHSALGALLMQVAPQELLYELGGLSGRAMKVLQSYIRPGSLPTVLTPLQPASDFSDPVTALKMMGARGYFKSYFSDMQEGSRWPSIFNGVGQKDVAAIALGALLSHLHRIKMDAEIPNGILCTYEVYKGFMALDGQTIVNLELLENTANGSKAGSLIGYLDSCVTAFGKRLLNRWICHPLQDIIAINRRLDAMEQFLSDSERSAALRGQLRKLPDLERLLARLRGFSEASSSEVLLPQPAFQRMLKTLCLAVRGLQAAYKILDRLQEMPAKAQLLRAACELLDADIPVACLRSIESHVDVEKISLKVDQDPDEDPVKSTTFLSWILLEFKEHNGHWAAIVDALSSVDVLLSFAAATVSANGPTCRPNFFVPGNGESVLEMRGLWHPYATAGSSTFVPNDVHLGFDSPRAVLLTGPNMGGKSTLLRATCVATLIAQLGCHVPSISCTLSPVDAIYTRIGARDRIMSGESTFMVECKEAGLILHNATNRSLVVLDELGRGTSTFDGYAIAYAVFRHLIEALDCRLLFATHYHPLTDEFSGNPLVSLQHMGCSFDTDGKKLVFLYKLQEGPCPWSYGLQVALLAGIPESVVQAAEAAGKLISSRLQDRRYLWLRQLCSMIKPTQASKSHESLLMLWNQMRRSNEIH